MQYCHPEMPPNNDSKEAPQPYPQEQPPQGHLQPPSHEQQPQPAAQAAPPLVTQSTADCQKAPQGYPQSPPQGYPQQQPQGYPQQQPQGCPQSPYGQQQPQPDYGVPSYQPQPGVVYVQPQPGVVYVQPQLNNSQIVVSGNVISNKPIRTVGKFYWFTDEWTAPDTPQEWTSSVVDCFNNCGNCFDVIMCMPCSVSHQMAASEGMRNHSTCGNCTMATLLFCFLPVFSCMIRKRVVKRYNIDDCSEGVGFGLCLFPCSLCQTHRELTARGMWPGGSCCESRSAGVPRKAYYPATHPRFQIVMK